MNSTLKINLIYCFLLCITCHCKKRVDALVLNELMASNDKTLADKYQEFDDWVELYNSSNHKVSLAGLSLTDDLEDPTKFTFPKDQKLGAKSYLILWLDDEPGQGPLHLPFKLNKDGDQLYLIAKDGRSIIDQIHFRKQDLDVSLARVSSKDTIWAFSYFPTPGYTNKIDLKTEGTASNVQFSQPAGFFPSSVEVVLSASETATIYYTLDGSSPVVGFSRIYENPIALDSSTVISAMAFETGKAPGRINRQTYLIGENSGFPTVSLSTSPVNLWDDTIGIAVRGIDNNIDKSGKAWERPGHFEYFDGKGVRKVHVDLEIALAGGATRRMHKTSFALTMKNKYGQNAIQYPFFGKANDRFKSLLLRSDIGGGSFMTNELIINLNKSLAEPVKMQGYHHVQLFINGKFWGLYTLMERKGEDFIRGNYEYDQPVDIIGVGQVYAGDTIAFDSLLKFIKATDIQSPLFYDDLANRVDIDNIIQHTIYNLYFNKLDYQLNTRFWKPRGIDAKWRMITFDYDLWTPIDNRPSGTLSRMLRKSKKEKFFFISPSLENEIFRHKMANKTADLCNTIFQPVRLLDLVDKNEAAISSVLERNSTRWPRIQNNDNRQETMSRLKDMINGQNMDLLQHMDTLMNLGGLVKVQLEIQGKGAIQLNSLVLNQPNWEGWYFRNVEIDLAAIPREGNHFVRWKGINFSASPKVKLKPETDLVKLIAVFESN